MARECDGDAFVDIHKLDQALAQRDALVKALEQIKIVCIDNAPTTVRHDLALEFVGGIAGRALDGVGGAKL